MDNVINKKYLFKKDFSGTSKKTGKPFRLIELHDESTLENTAFYLPENSKIPQNAFQTRDKVEGTFVMDVVFGEAKLVLESIRKVAAGQ